TRSTRDWSSDVCSSDLMEYLPPEENELWKTQLARVVVTIETASEVGRRLVSVHSAFAKSPTAAADFDTSAAFHALRLEPYLLARSEERRVGKWCRVQGG